MVKQRNWHAGWALAFLLSLSAQTFAQESPARVSGIVRSVGELGLAQAVLTLHNGATGAEVTVRTDSQGRYEAKGLAPGNYTVTVALSDFLTQVRTGVNLVSGQSAVADFVLEPEKSGPPASAPSQTPSASAPPSRAGGVINQSEMTGLPMNGRSVSQLATLEAGITDQSSSSGVGSQSSGGSSLTMSGGRSEWNGFLMDGTDINGTTNNVPQSAAGGQLGADSLSQIQVFSPSYDAQYGRAAGGVMSAITRAGTDTWHGTLFEFLRNSAVDARNFFDRTNKPPFKRNQFGGTVGGPIVKGNTFIMISSETLLDRLSVTSILFVPDNAVRQGILALPGKTPIPVDPRIMPYLPFYPAAGRPLLDSGGNPTGVAESDFQVFLPTNEYFFVARVDQRLSDHDAWFARYTFDDASTRNLGSALESQGHDSRQQYLTLTETHLFSPTLLNTTRLSYTRSATLDTTHFFVNIPPSLYFVPGAPQFGGLIVNGLSNLSDPPQNPQSKRMNSYQFAEDIIRSHGAHVLKFGMLVERFQWNIFDHESMGGRWTFSSLEDFVQAGPHGTTLQLGLPGSIPDRAFRQTLFAFYIQDDYKVRSNLALNLGLRYEFTNILHDVAGRTVFLIDQLHDPLPRVGPFMGRNPSLLNLAPRLGLRWSPRGDPKTGLSAGFGIYYDPIIEYSIDAGRATIPFMELAVRTNFDASLPGRFPDAVASAGVADQIRIFEHNNPKQPTVYRYNLSLQREVAPGLTVQAGYVGARGNHLLRTFEANQMPFPIRQSDGSLFFPAGAGPMNPAFGSMQKTNTDGQSFYNSFLISIKGTLRKGLSFNANYTYGKSVDDASTVTTVLTHYGIDRKLNRGLSTFDTRQRLSANYFYDLPLGTGQRWLNSGRMMHVAGGWRISGILRVQSGHPFDPVYGIPTPGFLFTSQRPNLTPGYSKNPTSGITAGCAGVNAGQKLGGPDLYFDPCAFTIPAPGTLGNAGRGTMIGPRLANLDFSLQKNFALDAKRNLQFRAEFFDLANHPNFQAPSSAAVFGNAQGKINPSVGRLTSTATTPRQIQFALRLSF